MVSATDAEVGFFFLLLPGSGTYTHHPIRNGPQKTAADMQTDYSSTNGILNNAFRQKQLKSMYMRFYWIIDCIKQDHLHFLWKPGPEKPRD